MSDGDRQRVARDLSTAASARRQLRPLHEAYPAIDTDDAYRIQLLGIQRRLDEGSLPCGHKVGLTAVAVQQMLGVNEPDYGHLLLDMMIDDGGAADADAFCQPRVEIEVAVVLARPLEGPGVTVSDVVRATDHLLPSIEIVDSRIHDWQITIEDTIADNASAGAFVLGTRPTRLDDVDVALLGGYLRKNGEIVETGCSGAVLGNPLVAVAWLANTIAAFGRRLDEGDVILPGACTRMVEVVAGDAIEAAFDSLGSVAVRFEGTSS